MFMGTKTYPSENEYSKYLSSNNGASNAWTAMTSTNYFFDVAPEALEGALDRFSGFFIEPLFAEDCTEREINAVNSEHKKNIQHDLWVGRSLSLVTDTSVSSSSKSRSRNPATSMASLELEISRRFGRYPRPMDGILAISLSSGGSIITVLAA